MTIALDANILVYATNSSDTAHPVASDLVQRLAAGPEIVYLFWPVAMAYLRIATDARILPHPLATAAAMANLEALLELDHVRSPGEGETFWARFRETAADLHARGRDIPDAHLVALMRQHDVRRLITRDRGFRRFEGIEVIDPFA